MSALKRPRDTNRLAKMILLSVFLAPLLSSCSSGPPGCMDGAAIDIVKSIAIRKTSRNISDDYVNSMKDKTQLIDITMIEQNGHSTTCEAAFVSNGTTYPRFVYQIQLTDEGKTLVRSDGP